MEPTRRTKNKLRIFYKAQKGLIHIPLNHLQVKTRATRSSDQSYVLPSSKVDGHLHSFYQNTVRLWSTLVEGLFGGALKNLAMREFCLESGQ